MKDLDFNSVLFHGIGRFKYKLDPEAELKVLEDILKSGAILSREEQIREFGEEYVEARVSGFDGFSNWNGGTYVSICQKKPTAPELKTKYQVAAKTTDESISFKKFVKYGIGIIISPMVFSLYRPHNNFLQDGEYQIKNKIPKKFFMGITVNAPVIENYVNFFKSINCPSDVLYAKTKAIYEESIIKQIEDLLEKYNYNLPIYTMQGKPHRPSKEILNELRLAAGIKNEDEDQLS